MRGISRARRLSWGFLFKIMIQRISVRIRVVSGDRTLLVKRANGRPSILGKYEIPGGKVLSAEQPDDAAKRYMADDLGVAGEAPLQLEDVFTYIDADDRDIQYVVIVYRAKISSKKRSISLSRHYNKYLWYDPDRLRDESITDVSRIILGSFTIHDALTVLPTTSGHSGPVDVGVVVYTDGGSRGNPGPSAAGYVIIDRGEVVDQGGEYLGITTNNQAEYHGVRIGLEAVLKRGVESVEVRVDSMLVANQLKGIYKIKNRELWPVNERVNELIGQFKRVTFTHIPRELNQLADGMVNRTLDQKRDSNMV